MAERKVLIKYYPPDFDPKYLKKNSRPKDKQDNVRMMMPLTCRCNTCGTYAGIGTKYNMRKETCLDEDYLGIRIYRFYFKCSNCTSELTFKTDPKNHDYVVEHGATRNYDPQRDMQAATEVLKELKAEDEEGNAMAFLENRTNDSKREIDINDRLEELRHQNKRLQKIGADQILKQLFLYEADQLEESQMTKEEKESFDAVKNRKRKNEYLDEDDEEADMKRLNEKFGLGGGSGNNNNDNNNIVKKENSKDQGFQKPKFVPIIKKKQIIQKDDEKDGEKKEQEKKQNNNNSLGALCDYSDSD